MKKIIFVLCCVFSLNAFAYPVTGEMPEKLKTFTDNLESVSATFKQTKILPESTKRFISNGYVKFVKNVGFAWHQQKPSDEIFTSTLTEYCVNGEAKELTELPYFYRVQSMIDKMLNGDMSEFLFAFDVDYSEHKNSWTLVASPRLVILADMIQNLTMYGNTKDLNKVIITYYDGTIVILEFNRSKKDFTDEIVC
ncbi:MAG: outer membrane lipoprotein carrier protein LolA [Alphaproteobacteria bacterium]|nr:outer membrane lipoprotein carrier protein LolA [Alphaproteobacteria bacterium]